MTFYEICFSPTGGTKAAADILTRDLSSESSFVDLTDYTLNDISLTKEDTAVIAVPSYGGRIPATAVQRMGKISGNGAKAILVCIYGNRAYEDTLIELQDVAEQCPVQAIDKNNPADTDPKRCISCMRCVSICPYSARKVNRIMLAGVNKMLKKTCSERKNCELYL